MYLEHGRTAGEHDVIVELSSAIRGSRQDAIVDDLGKRGVEVWGEHLGLEENLHSKVNGDAG